MSEKKDIYKNNLKELKDDQDGISFPENMKQIPIEYFDEF